MLNVRAELRRVIADALRAATESGELPPVEAGDIPVEYPPERGENNFGDYACPLPLSVGKLSQRPPVEIAKVIVKHLPLPEFVEKIEVAGPGFLNVFLKPGWIASKLDSLIEEGNVLGRADFGRGQSVNLEFVSGNPTGEVHVGNARALFSVDVLGRALAHVGWDVTREYLINDVGVQVERYGQSLLRRILQAAGHAVDYPEELYQGREVQEVAERVRESLTEDTKHVWTPVDLQNQGLIKEIARRGVEINVQEARRLMEEVAGVKYDVWFRESTLHAQGAVSGVVKELQQRGHVVEREGALWFRATAFGDDKDRVLVKSDGSATYLLSDIAYHQDKFRRGYQVIADFWGEDQFARSVPLRGALQALGEDVARLRFALVHLVRVIQGGEAAKLSKRAGTAVPLRGVLERVGVSAARFFLTMKSLAAPFDFDLDLAAARKEENPVYYVQYAYVRLASILRKAKERELLDESLVLSWHASPGSFTEAGEVRLAAFTMRFPEVLEDIARTWEVHRLPQYALDLARLVHRFYDTVPVLATTDTDTLRTRLMLTLAAVSVLGTIFDLLGIEKVEVM